MKEPINFQGVDMSTTIKKIASIILAVVFCVSGVSAQKAPFRILYNNDLTNLGTCLSPWNTTLGNSYDPGWMDGAVDETADMGIDVHMLAPGLQWIPFHDSTAYSLETHYTWFESTFGEIPSGGLFTYLDYIHNGGDLIQDFIDRCRLKGLTPFISFRLNDGHNLELANQPYDPTAGHRWSYLSKFYYDNPQYRIGTGTGWSDRVHNWIYQEVRDYKFNFLSEICHQYDIDGLELDYLRYDSFFRPTQTTSSQRKQIMTDFIIQVRQLLDETAQPGQYRYLAIRIPHRTQYFDALGIDLPSFVNAGVDMVILSADLFTSQQTGVAAVRQTIPDTALYLEIQNQAGLGKQLEQLGYGLTYHWRRATDNMIYTAAHLAYTDGVDGFSAFNLAYYRRWGTNEWGPFNEPPFHVFENLRNPAWIAAQPQHYILAKRYGTSSDFPFPVTVSNCQNITFNFKMAPPTGGWTTDGKLRIQAESNLANRKFMAWFNGQLLEENADVSEPYPNPYKGSNGHPDEFRAWTVPVHLLNAGNNTIMIRMGSMGSAVALNFLDLAVQ